MGEDSQSFPLSHYQAHHNTDQELATIKALKKERTNKCFIYIFAVFVILSVLLLIFALIVLRVNSPHVELSSVSVSKLTFQNSNSSSPNSFNLTLLAQITVDNSNFGPFSFENGTLGLAYEGAIVGERSTTAGTAKAKGTKRINVSVDASSKNVSGGINSGLLKLRSFAKLRGRVRLIEVFRKRTTAQMDCSMALNLNTRQIQDLVCK